METYPSNAHKPKNQAPKPEKKVEKVVTGHATTKKKSELRKFTDAFITEDAANVKSFIIQDVVIPAAKRIIDDVVVGSLRMILFGERGGSGRGGHTNASKVSYRSYYERENGRRDSAPSRVRSGFDYDNITFETRGDAEAVLNEMEAIIEQFDMVSVADLYDLADVSTSNYSANRYGWTNLSTAKIERDREGGYFIRLPRALPLN